ncbi:MAG: hypothetical protein QNL01_06040 [Akkermansiaceae bacterium]|jgi:hypothetical protein|tara:strand:+ start:1589 stop:2431 length:843 start_codon:yes stop_codon:yes gene_type:complete
MKAPSNTHLKKQLSSSAAYQLWWMIVVLLSGSMATRAQEKLPAPVVLPNPPSLIEGGQSGSITLTHVSSKPNKIIDKEDWWKNNGLKKPVVYERFLTMARGKIPASAPKTYRELPLVAVWSTSTRRFFSYGKQIYKARYLLVEGANGEIEFAFDAKAYGTVAWADVADGILYFTNNPGNISAASGGGARIFAVDLKSNLLKWASPKKVCKGQFAVVAGSVVCGYGFTGEPDAITVWDRFSGDLIQTIKLKTAANWIIQKKAKIYIRCYNTDEVFRIEIRD